MSFRLTPQALIDTLRSEYNSCKTDSCKVRVENLIAEELLSFDELESKKLSEKLFLSVKQSDSVNYLNAQFNYAFYCISKNQLNKSFSIFSELKRTALKNNNKLYLAKANFGLARYYLQNNDFRSATDLSFNALKIFEELKDNKFIAKSYFQIGLINYKLKNISKAIEFYKKSLDIASKIGYKNSIASAYSSLGIIYYHQDNYDIALEYYNRALRLRKQQKHEIEVAGLLANIGAIFSDKNQLQLAQNYFKESLELNLKYNKKNSLAVCYINIGNVSYNLNNFVEAEKNYTEALKYVDENDLLIKENLFYNLGEVNFKLGNFENSFKYQDSCITIKDSIYSRESIKSLNDMQTKYETTKTKLELEKKELEANNKQLIIYAAFGGCILLLGGVFFIFRGLKKQRRANIELEEKNSIIEEQKHIVEEKNKDISDSIRYAKRIQEAILPPDKMWYEHLPNSFVLYNPKDILSGDFYWLEQTEDYIFLAAADCTGHGVPGALMSIVNYNLLNKAVLEKNLIMPGEILDSVNYYLTHSLHQSYNESSIKDGMDITLLTINKKSKEVFFAGANNPIYIISDGRLQEVKADKFPVGAFIEENVQNFKTQKLNVKRDDIIYLFTDGYADQFGGPKGKKFKYKQFSDLLLENCNKPLSQQQLILQQQFINWKGNLEQVDDVCVLGIKL
ncbi:MAG: tetratricopeptide repeat protein [Bacteroidota bacterium]|nr:tetratricopeptide repeat protein [Bacteroidota bacterium]